MAKQLNVNLAFTADTGQAKAQIADLQTSLSQLMMNSKMNGKSLGLSSELSKATAQVAELKTLLSASTSATGQLDLSKFNNNLKSSGKTIQDYAKTLDSLGPRGREAFSQLASAITTAEVSFKKANSVLSEMWTTMKNTVRWQLTSSALHSFIGGLQQAYGYAKDLNKALTDIRIVAPEKTMEDMADFAQVANHQAKELGSSTLKYVKGALIYYQQGLNDIETKARTDVTMKMSNVTGDSTEDVSSYMTAIWNNFNKEGQESEEHYADILTKLGADTAASTTEITSALEKYSAVADTIGLSYEAATAAATTLIDRTREAPEVAGTALKTVFARLQGLKLNGEVTDEDGVTTDLNKYSSGLASVGVQIKDANGELKSADMILEEIGEKWKTLDRDQQVALAQTVAGLRQYNQFAALMDNYDYYEKYKEIAESGSDGTLQEQQDIYAESWEAANNRVKASMETLYQQLLDDSFFIGLTNGLANVLDLTSKFVDSIGGLKGVLPLIGGLMLKAFGPQIADSLDNLVQRIKLKTKSGQAEILKLRKDANKALSEQAVDSGLLSGGVASDVYKKQSELQDALIVKEQELNALGHQMTDQEKQLVGYMLDEVKAKGQQAVSSAKELENIQKQTVELEHQANISKNLRDVNNKFYNKNAIDKTEKDKTIPEPSARELTGDLNKDTKKIGEKYKESQMAFLANERYQDKLPSLQDPTKSSDVFKTITEDANNMAQALEKTGQEGTETYKILQKIGQMSGVDATEEKIEQLTNNLKELDNISNEFGISAEDLAGDLLLVAKAGNADSESLKGLEIYLEKIKAKFTEEGAAAMQAAEANSTFVASNKGASNVLEKLKGKTQSFGTIASEASMHIMNIGMSISAISSLGSIWDDEELSTGEKYVQTLMSMSMALMGVNSLIAMGTEWGPGIAKGAGKIVSSLLNVDKAALKAASGLGKIKLVLTALMGSPGVLLGIAAAITAIGLAVMYFKKKHDEADPAKKLEELQQQTEQAQLQFDAVKEKVDEVNSSLDSLEDKQQALEGLKMGTSEWRKALTEANDTVLDTIENVNDLSNSLSESDKKLLTDKYGSAKLKEGVDYYKDANGELKFTDIGQAKIDAINSMVVANANIEVASAKISENRQQREVDEQKLGKKISKISGEENVPIYTDDEIQKMGGRERHEKGIYKTQNGEWQGNSRKNENALTEEEATNITSKIADFMLANPTYSTDDLSNKNSDLYNALIDQGIISKGIAKDLSESKSFISSMTNHVQNLSAMADEEKQAAQDSLLNADDGELSKKLYGYIDEKTGKEVSSQLDEKYRNKYESGLVDLMSEDVITRRDKYVEDPKKYKLYEDYGGDKQAAQEDFLTQGGYKEDKNGNYKNAEGEKIDKGDIEQEVANWLAYKKAVDDTNASFDDYKALLEDTERDNEDLANIKNTWKDQSENIKLAKDATNAYAKEIKQAKKDGKDWSEGISDEKMKRAAKAMNRYAETIRDDLGEALDITSDSMKESIIDGEFVAENAKLIEDALEGDMGAIEQLQDKAAHKILLEADIKSEDMQGLTDVISNYIDETNFEDIEIGASIDDSQIYPALQSMLASGEMTAEEMQGLMNSMGYKCKIEMQRVYLTDENVTENAGGSTASYTYDVPNIDPETGLPDGTTHSATSTFTIHGSSKADGGSGRYIEVPQIIPEKSTFQGANINKVGQGGSQPRRPSGGGGGGGGGGGRRGGGRRSRPARHQTKESKVDRYKDVTQKIEKVSRAAEKLQDTQEQLYGKKRLNNMDKVNAKLKEELKYINEKNVRTRKFLELDRQRLQQDYDALKNQLKKSKAKINIGIADFTFDSTGRINNYNTIMDKLQNELDKHVDKMNKQKNEDKQNEYKEKYMDPIEETIDGIQALVDQYEETYEEMLSQIDDWQDKYNEILDNNYEKITYQIELDTTISDNAESILDYYLDKIEDSSYKVGELFNLYFGSEGQLAQIENKIGIYTDKKFDDAISGEKVDYLQHLSDAYLAGEITQANYVEGLQEEYDAMLDNLSALSDLKDNMDDYYNNILSEVQDEIDKYTQSVEYAAQALEHWRNLIELTGDGKEYNQLIMIQKQLRDNAEQTYNNSIIYYNELIKNVEEFKEKNVSLLPTYDEEQLTKYQEELNAMVAAAEEAGDQVMSDYENLLETAQELLELELEQANKTIDELLSGVTGGFEELTRIMDLTSTGQDEYLTKTNQIYEMNKLLRNLRTDMDKTENKSAKQRLNNFAKELEQLKQKDELSQLELDIAEARYKQLQAQIALEEAQNAKQTIRLSRDNEGNYGYVYTANEDAVNDAQQALDDASNELYNIYLTGNNDYNEKIINYAQEMLQNIQEINENQELSQAEKDDRIEKIREQYGSLIGDASDLVDIAKQGLINEFNASGEAWTNKYDDNVSSILTNLSSGVDGWLDNINVIKDEFKGLADKYKDLEQGIIDTGLELGEEAQAALTGPDGVFAKGFEALDTSINNLIDYIFNDLPEINNELSSLESLVRQIKDMIALEVNEGVQTYFNYNELIKYLSESQSSNGKQVSYNTKLNAAGGRVLTDSSGNEFFTTPAENIDNDAIAEDIYQNYIKQGKHGVISYDKDGKLIFAASESAIVSDKEYTNLTKKLANKDSNARVLRFASGGYTGSWNGEQGKLALLDKKELVLNEYDTQNLLSSVDIIRSVVDQIDLQTMANTISGLTSATIGNIDNSSSVDQNVVISADFPNVSSRDEIEAAFDNLINRAAQYSYRNK